MCGIYASLGFAPEPERIDMVAYRGPDGRGWQEHASPRGPVALGHRRLAIIDTSDAGLQPMADPTGRYHLVFNGEIYNYIELREELAKCGETWFTETDSEVLLRAVAVWGLSALPRLHGMFAFVIWDDRDKVLFAARDRFGIKPLYIVANSTGIAFASEVKQLLGLPGVDTRLNLPRVYDYLAEGISDHTSETMFAAVHQVRAGECVAVAVGRNGRVTTERTRWYPVATGNHTGLSERQAADRFHELLADSVRFHLRSDVPVGSCLSGGLDFSSIVCLMAGLLGSAQGGRKVETVSACYEEKNVDERPYMDAVVCRTGAARHLVFPRAEDVFAQAEEVTWHQDEPFASTSIFAQWCVFEEARRSGIKVMLDGQGADEQLAGYHSSYPYYLADLVRHRQFGLLLRTIGERHQFNGVSIPRQLLAVMKSAISFALPARLADTLRQSHRATSTCDDWLASEALRPLAGKPSAHIAACESLGLPQVRDISTLCRSLVFATNLQMLLHWEDRNSMAHSIEARVPFLDHRLVEFSLSLGGQHKIVAGETKRVLRQAMRGILPDQVCGRRDKLGFSTPEQAWFRGPLRGLVHEGVEATLIRFPGLLDGAATRKLAAEMLDGRRSFESSLWRIVNLGIWGRRFAVSA